LICHGSVDKGRSDEVVSIPRYGRSCSFGSP
jgi:hypothetical protein